MALYATAALIREATRLGAPEQELTAALEIMVATWLMGNSEVLPIATMDELLEQFMDGCAHYVSVQYGDGDDAEAMGEPGRRPH